MIESGKIKQWAYLQNWAHLKSKFRVCQYARGAHLRAYFQLSSAITKYLCFEKLGLVLFLSEVYFADDFF